MAKKYFLGFIVIIIAIALIVGMFTCPKQQSPSGDDYSEAYEDYAPAAEDEEQMTEEPNNFYHAPAFLWPKITYGGTFTAVVFIVFFSVGILSYLFGHFAGAKQNKKQIRTAIGIAVLVGVLGRSVMIFIEENFFHLLLYILPNNELLAGTIAELIIYILWTTYIAGISVYIYEIFTVTAKEMFQNR